MTIVLLTVVAYKSQLISHLQFLNSKLAMCITHCRLSYRRLLTRPCGHGRVCVCVCVCVCVSVCVCVCVCGVCVCVCVCV